MKKTTAFAVALLSMVARAVSMEAWGSCTLPATTHGQNITELTGLLPGDARGTLAVDLEALLAGSASAEVAALLNGDGSDPALNEPLSAIGDLAANIDIPGAVMTALLAQTRDGSEGLLLLAKLRCDTLAEVVAGEALTPDGTYGADGHAMHLDVNGSSLCLLTGGVLIVGTRAAVESVLDVADGVSPANASEIEPFLSELQSGAPFTFVYGLPAMFNGAITPDRSLRGAELLSGSLDFGTGTVNGSVAFHTSNAADFVDAYNALDSASGEAPLGLAAPVANGLSRAVVTIPATPINKSGASLMMSRNTLKKLVLGMEAHDYAEDVADPGNKPMLDLTVMSEEDDANTPGSVFIRWEFKDQAAMDAFEANELPAGFTLADCRFLESDGPGKFLALNLYNSGGGSIVNGARAEWDVFVNPPVGADPDAGSRPRFMVIDALAQAVSADPVNGLTPAEPLSHSFIGGQVVTSVHKMEGGVDVAVFESALTKPDRATAPVARFTREMAISNDYIYWGHGVYDRARYNASTFNYDAYLVDLASVSINDLSHWKQYLEADPTYVVYYVNTLEYIASPWDNLNSPYLDITPEWLSELYAFKNNGNYLTLMREAVQGAFRGTADAVTPLIVPNTVPTVYYHFRVTKPVLLASALQLGLRGYTLARTRLLESDPAEDYYLTLRIYEIEGAVEGTRAEWGVYVTGDNGRAHLLIIDLQTEEAALDPGSMIRLASRVDHAWSGSVLRTVVSSSGVDFDASFDTLGSADEALTLDWIEAEETVCRLIGICSKLYYDAETLDAPVHLPASVTVNTIETPWNAYVETTPSRVFYRENAQEYAIKPWQNLKVVVEDPPEPPPCFSGTHTITGSGSLTGRTNPAVDSSYTYYGGASVAGDVLNFIMDQTIVNALGESHILTEGYFSLGTGLGESTVLGCSGPALMCAGVDPIIGTPEATSEYYAMNLDASDPDHVTWDVIFVLTVPGFGEGDSDSSISADLGDPTLPEDCGNGVDDDCDEWVDCDDSECSGAAECGAYPGVANATAGAYGASSLTGSGALNVLALLLAPVGAAGLLRSLRRRR